MQAGEQFNPGRPLAGKALPNRKMLDISRAGRLPLVRHDTPKVTLVTIKLPAESRAFPWEKKKPQILPRILVSSPQTVRKRHNRRFTCHLRQSFPCDTSYARSDILKL